MSAHILVIDDEESIRFTFKSFLSEEGHNVTAVKEYEEAIDVLSSSTFDLIITDIILGGKTGLDILHFLRERGKRSPIILITGFPSVETAAEAVRLGAFDYVMKPVTKGLLLRIVKKALYEHKPQDTTENKTP